MRTLLSLLVYLLPMAAYGQTPAPPAASAVAQYLLNEMRNMNRVPGLSAAVSTPEGALWTGTSGWADLAARRPVSADTSFRLASVSKLFTASLALRISQTGDLNMDAGLTEQLPQLPAHFARVTPRNLASHTSGMGHYIAADATRSEHRYATLTDTLPIYVSRDLLASPGATYHYSSWGYALLGAVLEKSTGLPFHAALSQHILEPLELNHTFVEDIEALPPHTTALYERRAEGTFTTIDPNDQTHAIGATGIRSTPADLVTFAAAYAAGEIVKSELRDQSWTPVLLTDGSEAGTNRYKMGTGWRLAKDWDGRAVVHHSGSTPGARSVLLVYRVTGAAVALLSNASWSSRIEPTAELLAAPFLELASFKAQPCPEGNWPYTGSFKVDRNTPALQQPARGILRIANTPAGCAGQIEPTATVASWLTSQHAGSDYLAMARIAMRGDEHIFALVTPWGLSPLRLLISDFGTITGIADIAGRPLRIASP